MKGQIERDAGYAWVVLLAASFINFLNGSVSASYGVFLAEYVEYFHIKKAKASIVSALGVGFGYCVGFLVGFFVSHLGVRKATFISALLLSAGCSLSYIAPNVYVLYFTHGLFPGIGITAYLIVGQASIGDYFKKYVGLAQAILTSGSCVGYTICPPILALLVDYYGWRGAMLLLGGLNLHGFIMALLFPSSKRKPPKTPVKQQSNDSSIAKETAKPSIFEDFIIVKDIKFIIYLACMGVGSVGQTTMYVFMVARAQSIGISKENSALLFTIYGIVSIFSRPLFGTLADKIAKHRIALMSVCIVVCGFISAAVNWMESFGWMVVYVASFGCLSSGYMALIATVLGDILPPKRLALAIGLLWSVVGVASIGSTACSGYLVDVTGSYGTPFLVFGLVSASAGIGGFALYWLIIQERRKGKKDIIRAEEKSDTEMLEINKQGNSVA